MATMDVLFQIPGWIQSGLNTHQFERFGGVIRESATGKIVTFLREQSPASLFNLAPNLMRSSDYLGVLNLGISCVGFGIVLNRIERLGQEVNNGLIEINRKLDTSHFIRFRAALELAENALEAASANNRAIAAQHSINGLLESQHYFDAALNEPSPPAVRLRLLQSLTLSYVAEVVCHLELGEADIALKRLEKGLVVVTPLAIEFVRCRLQEFANPYQMMMPRFSKAKTDSEEVFDDTISRVARREIIFRLENIERYSRICKWVGCDFDIEAGIHALRNMQSVDERRHQDFLAKSASRIAEAELTNARRRARGSLHDKLMLAFADGSSVIHMRKEAISNRKVFAERAATDFAPLLASFFDEVESVIEDMERFGAYRHEIQEMRRSGVFHDWQGLASYIKSSAGDQSVAGSPVLYLVPCTTH